MTLMDILVMVAGVVGSLCCYSYIINLEDRVTRLERKCQVRRK